MQYSEYDLLLKYSLAQERLKSVYFGDSSIYADGRELEIFPENGDKVNGRTPLFVFGTVVYLFYDNKFLILEQKKEDRVVDTLVGLGGKLRPILGNVVQDAEKNNINRILNAYEVGQLDTEEEIKQAAAREVMEETSTYSIDCDGNYTHEIVSNGIEINPSLLNKIGVSRIRCIANDKTECWMILNFVYKLSKEEYDFIENYVSKSNREGILHWMTLDEALPYMSNSDRIILRNFDKQVTVSEIRDNINNQNIVRFKIGDINKKYFGTLINDVLVNASDDIYYDLIGDNQHTTFTKKN